MSDRKEIKRRAREHVRRHYVLLTVLCALSIFLGTEFTNVVSNAQVLYNIMTGQVAPRGAEGARQEKSVSSKLVDVYLDDYFIEGREEAAERMQAIKDSADPNSMLGRQRGVLAAVMNNINSGQLTATLGMALHSILHSDKAAAVLMILGSAALTSLVWVFFQNLYKAVMRRAMLETRVYKVLPLSHLFFFKTVGRWNRAALTLLLESVYEWLWDLTVVGGIIKHYSYYQVPYIVAENPDIRPREAILLSRRMMDGHKWECCKLELSFAGWIALGFFTFGATEVFWSIPYRMATFIEYYAQLRREAIEKAIPGAERLNDECLYTPAEEAELRDAYADIQKRMDIADGDIVALSPVQRFFAANFGIWTASLAEKKVYSRQAGLRQQMRIGRAEMEGRAYPQRLCPLWNREAAGLTGRVNYLTPCTVWSLIAVFFTFSIIGWVWEVSLHLITDGELVNRGILHGPWLPIYGGGVTLIAVLLYRFRRQPALEAITVVALCGFVEYATSYMMELAHGVRWWDYTGYFLNLNGRICGEGLLVFALGGMAAIYLLVPVIDAAVTRIRPKLLIPVCVALLLCFSVDLVYSQINPNTGRGVTDIGDDISITSEQLQSAPTHP